MSQVPIWTAFIAGIVSFLSPCVLPLVPGYISFMSGITLEELSKGAAKKLLFKKAGLSSVFFVLGFSLVFTALGASATTAGQFLVNHMEAASKIAGALIILFGLHTLGILPIQWLYYEKKFQPSKINPGQIGSFVMGLAFAFGWTPCIGPILAAILAIAAAQETVVQGMTLLLVYSLGLGIPFILTGFSVNLFLQFFNRYKKFIRWGEIFAGILLLGIGGLIFSNKLAILIGLIPEGLFIFSF